MMFNVQISVDVEMDDRRAEAVRKGAAAAGVSINTYLEDTVDEWWHLVEDGDLRPIVTHEYGS